MAKVELLLTIIGSGECIRCGCSPGFTNCDSRSFNGDLLGLEFDLKWLHNANKWAIDNYRDLQKKLKAETEKNKQEWHKTCRVLQWFLQSGGVFSHTSLQSPRKEISRNHVIVFLRIYFTQLPFKHPVTHCRSVAHQHIFNYLAELGTSRARKWIALMEHWRRVMERHGLMGGVSTAAASLHTMLHPLWHLPPVHKSGTTPQSQPHGAIVPSMCQQILPEMICYISLLELSNTKKDRQEVSSKCHCFILARGVSLPQILLDLPMFSWYVLHFCQIISAFHLYLAREQGRVTFHSPGLQTAPKRAQWSCEHDLKPK